jgi:hypothetical protein
MVFYCRLRYRHDYARVANADVSVRVRVRVFEAI